MGTGPPAERGFSVDLQKTKGGEPTIRLSERRQADFGEIQKARDAHGIYAALCVLLEDHPGNGWETVSPEDMAR